MGFLITFEVKIGKTEDLMNLFLNADFVESLRKTRLFKTEGVPNFVPLPNPEPNTIVEAGRFRLEDGENLKEKYVYELNHLATLTAKDFIDVVRLHAEDGVDFVTLHCGITRKTIEQIKNHKRKMNIVSRGGSLVFAWMCMTGNENPFYEYYDEILDICREYDVTISLGDACRPGCLADASDVCQIEELVRLGELTKRAWAKDVQVMVEGPGHMPLDQIAANMKIQQTICGGAPFYVLGPLVTDIAPGYDHITAAIGGAVAATAGAAFLCYVTPAEHLALPNVDDVKQGIIASKIAAHAADIAAGNIIIPARMATRQSMTLICMADWLRLVRREK